MREPSEPSAPLDATAESSTSTTTPAPVVVIEYRQHGFASKLVPPAMILVAALALVSWQRTTPIRPLASLVKMEPTVQANANANANATLPKPVVADAPRIAFREATDAKPAPPTDSAKPAEPNRPDPPRTEVTFPPDPEQPPPPPSPFDLGPVAGLQPVTATEPPRSDAAAVLAEPVANPNPAPMPAPGAMPANDPDDPPKEAILQDIQREAEQKNAQQEEMERLKPQAAAMLAAEAFVRVQEERTPFRKELRQLVKDLGNSAGPDINRLCDQYGREAPGGAQDAYARLLRTTPGRVSRETTVNMMRACGIPEPLILDNLAHQFHKQLNTRGGPRDTHEVRVYAARALLAIPLPAGRKPVPRPGAGQAAAAVNPQPSPVVRP